MKTYEIKTAQYPSKVMESPCGKCLIATQDLAKGSIVERFDGPLLKYEEVPEEEICYVGCQGDGYCMIPQTPARYINHSCDPNCVIQSNGDVVAIRPIKDGEEITFDYVSVSKKEFEQNPEAFFWDPRWSFNCLCGALHCHKRIDRYIIH